jgi:hypothetical protein
MTVRIHRIGVVVGPSRGARGDVQAAQVKIPSEIPGNGTRPKPAQRRPIQVTPGVDIAAPGLGGNVGSS